ncbi:MAG: hypothetical protein KDD38_04020 [Bdellovibrionales bacterium]|nr:hypothetical protein [Bdellovibrionales bacterium]
MSFHFKIESTPSQEIVQFSGTVDENAKFNDINLKQNTQLIIDMKNVNLLNSLGLRNWILWVKTLKQYTGGIFLRNCPNVVVHQMNVLDGFLPLHATVESILIPFLCDSCGHEFDYLATRGKDYKEAFDGQSEAVLMPLEQTCTKCGKIAEADIIPAKHFQFLKRRR